MAKAMAKTTKGGGTKVGIIPASAHGTGHASGVTRSGVKSLTKTSSAWESAKELARAGLISRDALNKMAALRQGILASAKTESTTKLAEPMPPDELMDRIKNFFKGDVVHVGDATFYPQDRQLLGRILRDMHGEKAETIINDTMNEAVPWSRVKKMIKALHPQPVRGSKWIPAVLGPAALGVGAAVGSRMDDWFENRQADKDIKDMMHAVPELRQEDVRRVHSAYSVVRRLSPSLSKNPVATGHIVKQLVHLGNLADVQTAQALTQVEANMRKSKDTRHNLITETIRTMLAPS